MGAYRGVALDGVEDCGFVNIEDTLELQSRMIDGRLEVAVLRIDHEPYVCLHVFRKASQDCCAWWRNAGRDKPFSSCHCCSDGSSKAACSGLKECER